MFLPGSLIRDFIDYPDPDTVHRFRVAPFQSDTVCAQLYNANITKESAGVSSCKITTCSVR